jgi:hypothetical protein
MVNDIRIEITRSLGFYEQRDSVDVLLDAPIGDYEKPIFEKEKSLTFPKEIMEQFNGGRFCVQCSGCHGCR